MREYHMVSPITGPSVLGSSIEDVPTQLISPPGAGPSVRSEKAPSSRVEKSQTRSVKIASAAIHKKATPRTSAAAKKEEASAAECIILTLLIFLMCFIFVTLFLVYVIPEPADGKERPAWHQFLVDWHALLLSVAVCLFVGLVGYLIYRRRKRIAQRRRLADFLTRDENERQNNIECEVIKSSISENGSSSPVMRRSGSAILKHQQQQLQQQLTPTRVRGSTPPSRQTTPNGSFPAGVSQHLALVPPSGAVLVEHGSRSSSSGCGPTSTATTAGSTTPHRFVMSAADATVWITSGHPHAE